MGIFNTKKVISLKEVSEKLNMLHIPIALCITPINLKEEKEKFLENDSYNPQFKYKRVGNDNGKILRELENITGINDVDPRISDFYIQLIQDKKEANNLMNAIGDNGRMSELSKDRFGMPSYKLYKSTCLVLKGKTEQYNTVKVKKSSKFLHKQEVISAFRILFDELNLKDWSAQPSKNIPKNRFRTALKEKMIRFDPDISRSRFGVKKAMIHEVGTHVLRSVNGEFSGYNALAKPNIKSYLEVEEGLALYNEEYFGHLTPDYLKYRALLLYAIYIGEKMSFRELHNILLGFVPKVNAFNIAYRVKRGLSDTSKPGIYSKDLLYFKGFKKVRRMIEEDKSLYKLLYAGKIDFKMTSWVREGLIPMPKILPTKEIFEKAFLKAGI
ncbi:flavohemoglobin expression-modulating QEGLA motif protein [Candidatus Dojkabacteria bacterium]|jgi:hypothetical protein|nr:flavohemoglobin expression-modulating QEGLA motif protein [Candidatus Dojkabacteria bacterium]